MRHHQGYASAAKIASLHIIDREIWTMVSFFSRYLGSISLVFSLAAPAFADDFCKNLDVSRAKRDGGYAYIVDGNFRTAGDTSSSPTRSVLKLRENGREIGPAHSSHSDIRSNGAGRFSHWGNRRIYLSASDNTNPRTNGKTYSYCLPSTTPAPAPTLAPVPAPAPTVCRSDEVGGALSVESAASDEGYAYTTRFIGFPGDSNDQPRNSTLRLMEDGREIGPAHSNHQEIRDNGRGRFSHWRNSIYFSASDNSNPRTNGKKYSYCVKPATAPVPSPKPSPVVSPSPKPSPVVSPTPKPSPIVTPTPTSTAVPPAPAPTPKPSPSPSSPVATVPVPLGIMGYAAMNGGTTGGAGGETVTVTTFNQLNSAVQGDTPRIIRVSGAIRGNDQMVSIGSNKSIIGNPGAEIHAIGLYMFGTHNVIIQNLKLFDGGNPTGVNSGGYSPFTAKEGAHHVWVDHVEFYPSSDPDNGHTMAAVTKGSDFVTFSWCSFFGKYTGLLIGGSEMTTSDIGHLTVTVHHSLFDEMLERQPKVRFGNVHVFNTYYRNAKTEGHTPFGITVTMGGTVRTDANYFENFKGYPISTRYNPTVETDGYISGLETNYKDSVGSYSITTPASNWKPPYPYANYLTPVMDVPKVVLNGVGAILK